MIFLLVAWLYQVHPINQSFLLLCCLLRCLERFSRSTSSAHFLKLWFQKKKKKKNRIKLTTTIQSKWERTYRKESPISIYKLVSIKGVNIIMHGESKLETDQYVSMISVHCPSIRQKVTLRLFIATEWKDQKDKLERSSISDNNSQIHLYIKGV